MENLITDVTACYKNVDENNVSAILEIKKSSSEEYEMILKYTFSINVLERNSIEVYKDLKIPELYNIYTLLKNNPNYKGIFDIYFRIYKNELNDLRFFAIDKMKEVNDPKKEIKEKFFSQIKNNTKKLFQEIWEEGSTDERNGNIIKVAAYKKEHPIDNFGGYSNRYAIDIVRYGNDVWENIYSYEFGKYKVGGVLTDVNSVSVYKKLQDSEIFKVLSLIQTEEECEVVSKYLKTVPKEPHGEIIDKKDDGEPKIENIKFL